MTEMHTRNSNSADRRHFLRTAAALGWGGTLWGHATSVQAAACSALLADTVIDADVVPATHPPGKVTVKIDSDYKKLRRPLSPGTYIERNGGRLAQAIFTTFNSDYFDSSADIVMSRFKFLDQMIQRHKATPKNKQLAWTFDKTGSGLTTPIAIDHAIRIPYFGTTNKGSSRCTPEHVLVGYAIGAEATVGTFEDWFLDGTDDYEKLGKAIISLLKEDDGDSKSVKQWCNADSTGMCQKNPIIEDPNEQIWSFRNTPVHIDRAISIPFAVSKKDSAGTLKVFNAILYVGYEGGAGY